MRTRHHVALHALAIAVAVAAVVFGLAGFFGQSHHQVVASADAQIKQRAVAASVAAQQVPNPACAPTRGTGRMGICAPVQAQGVANVLAKAAGDPGTVNGPLGIDRSSYQGCTSVRGLGVHFEYFKANESTGYSDFTYGCNTADARALRIPYGGYDFLRPGWTSAQAEAARYVAVVKAHPLGGLPPAADVEVSDGQPPQYVHAYACAWLRTVQAALHTNRGVIYTGNWFWAALPGGNCGADLWVSAYTLYPLIPSAWAGHFQIWQYSGDGVGPDPHCWGALGCQIDSDVFHGTQAQLNAYANAAPAAKPVAARFNATCRELDRITWLRHHHPARFRPHQHTRAVALRGDLAAHHVGCTRPGWQARPRNASPAHPYPYPRRKGALA